MVSVQSRATKKVGSWKSGSGGGDGANEGGGSGKTGGCGYGCGGSVGRYDGDGGECGSMGSVDNEVQVVGHVLHEDLHGTSGTVQQQNRNIFRLERVLVHHDQMHTFDHRIRAINQTHFQ